MQREAFFRRQQELYVEYVQIVVYDGDGVVLTVKGMSRLQAAK